MLGDKNTVDEAQIKIRFNNLVSQFENNKRYTSLDKFTLSDEEDISYEMTVHNKSYEALFFQVPNMENMEMMVMKPVWFKICESYGEYYICMYYDNIYNQANGEDL